MWSSTISSYRVLPLCHRRLTPRIGSLSRMQRHQSGFITCGRRRKSGHSWKSSRRNIIQAGEVVRSRESTGAGSPLPSAFMDTGNLRT